MTTSRLQFILSALPAGLACVHAAEPGFNRDIRPILSENCFLCHGQDPKHRGGELRLDNREDAVAPRDGVAAIVPGKPDQSGIIQHILSDDPELVNPLFPSLRTGPTAVSGASR